MKTITGQDHNWIWKVEFWSTQLSTFQTKTHRYMIIHSWKNLLNNLKWENQYCRDPLVMVDKIVQGQHVFELKERMIYQLRIEGEKLEGEWELEVWDHLLVRIPKEQWDIFWSEINELFQQDVWKKIIWKENFMF